VDFRLPWSHSERARCTTGVGLAFSGIDARSSLRFFSPPRRPLFCLKTTDCFPPHFSPFLIWSIPTNVLEQRNVLLLFAYTTLYPPRPFDQGSASPRSSPISILRLQTCLSFLFLSFVRMDLMGPTRQTGPPPPKRGPGKVSSAVPDFTSFFPGASPLLRPRSHTSLFRHRD